MAISTWFKMDILTNIFLFSILILFPIIITIIKDRNDYFEWKKKYETKRSTNDYYSL